LKETMWGGKNNHRQGGEARKKRAEMEKVTNEARIRRKRSEKKKLADPRKIARVGGGWFGVGKSNQKKDWGDGKN